MVRMPWTTVAVALCLVVGGADAAEPLFPRPLHLTREIEDPVTGRTTTVEEYFAGNRAVSVAGALTSIVDYGRGESTRIDRAEGMFSVATLDALARAARAGRARPAAAARQAWSLRETGSHVRGSRAVTVYRASDDTRESEGPRVDLEVVIDRGVALTRGGAEVIAGAAWPNESSPEADAILRAARGEGAVAAGTAGSASAADRYGLPLETILTWREGGEEIRLVNRIVRVGAELPPVASVEVPRGARAIDDPRVAAAALLEALDRTGAPKE